MHMWRLQFLCLLFHLVSSNNVDQELDGEITLIMKHSFDHGKNWHTRGSVTVHNTRNGAASFDQHPLPAEHKNALAGQCEAQGLYLMQLVEQHSSGEQLHRSAASACLMMESGLMDTLTLNLDWRGKLGSVVIGIQQPSAKNSLKGVKLDLSSDQDHSNFKTKVIMQRMENGPVPDTAAFIQKMEEEKRKAEKGEVKDNRSFLAKYWMYIVPIVIFMAINGAAAPEGQ